MGRTTAGDTDPDGTGSEPDAPTTVVIAVAGAVVATVAGAAGVGAGAAGAAAAAHAEAAIATAAGATVVVVAEARSITGAIDAIRRGRMTGERATTNDGPIGTGRTAGSGGDSPADRAPTTGRSTVDSSATPLLGTASNSGPPLKRSDRCIGPSTPCTKPVGADGSTACPGSDAKDGFCHDASPARKRNPSETPAAIRRTIVACGGSARQPPSHGGRGTAARGGRDVRGGDVRGRNGCQMPTGHPPSLMRVLIRAISRTHRCRSWWVRSRMAARGQWKW
jgi:hypothetical protein